MSEQPVFNPLDPGTPRCPAGRDLMNDRLPINTDILLVDTSPRLDFGRRDLTCEGFIRQFLKFHVTPQLPCNPPDTLTDSPFAKNTRHKVFQMFRQHLPRCAFAETVFANTDTLVDAPLFTHANKASFHHLFRPYLVAMLTLRNAEAP